MCLFVLVPLHPQDVSQKLHTPCRCFPLRFLQFGPMARGAGWGLCAHPLCASPVRARDGLSGPWSWNRLREEDVWAPGDSVRLLPKVESALLPQLCPGVPTSSRTWSFSVKLVKTKKKDPLIRLHRALWCQYLCLCWGCAGSTQPPAGPRMCGRCLGQRRDSHYAQRGEGLLS